MTLPSEPGRPCREQPRRTCSASAFTRGLTVKLVCREGTPTTKPHCLGSCGA